jgi:hypothetical protein
VLCLVVGCSKEVSAEVKGSGYCTAHEYYPIGHASFSEVRQILIDLRDSVGYENWKQGIFDCKKGWDKLETYTNMMQLGQCKGVGVTDGMLHEIDLANCNLVGTLPATLAKLDTLVELDISFNDLSGYLPAHLGKSVSSSYPLLLVSSSTSLTAPHSRRA